MQQKNFVIFIITCLVIMVGWMWLQERIWPPRPRNKDDKAAEKKAAPVIALPRLKDIWQDLTAEGKHAAAVSALAFPPSLVLFYNPNFPAFLAANIKIKLRQPKEETQTYTLGETDANTPADKRFFITAVFTNRGAGIQKVTLNDFNGADRLGLGTGQLLHLV